MENPKLFVSYSWSSPAHEEWVVQLASELLEAGVNVVLDKWDLKEGHDADMFMEQMVNDPEIKKVILICDKMYVEKTNQRKGGAGTEAQIISAELYKKQKQDKFVAIVTEHDENGEAILPTYYKSRIYIDLSEPENYSKNFEQLLRWIYDKPLYVKPEIGKMPAFLNEKTKSHLPTAVLYKRTVDALKNQKEYSEGSLQDYFSIIVDNFEGLRIIDDETEFDDKVVESIESFLPFRDEIIDIFLNVAKYKVNFEVEKVLHRFFENLIPFLFRPEHINQYREWDFDNYRFIIHELFLYLIASLLKYERFETVSYLMRNDFYIHGNSEYGRDQMVPFRVLRQYMKSLEYRNKRLNLRRLSVRADLLSKRSTNPQILFRSIMQADFVLFIRDHLHSSLEAYHWWPETLLYSNRLASSFELFARCQSKEYFEKAKKIFDIENKDVLLKLTEEFKAERKKLIPRWQFDSFNPSGLLGITQIATKP